MIDQGYINHIALVLDASSSMSGLKNELIKVVDNQISYLALRSKELDQETRVTVYTFAYKTECLIYDKDVLRLPSIAPYYRPNGMTALVDATVKSQEDLAKTAQLYGDHAFLTYVLTDGQENQSTSVSKKRLPGILTALPDNWTLAVMVPDKQGEFEAKKWGFGKDAVAIWDSTSAKGISEAGKVIRDTTEAFMQGRAQGIRGSKGIFDMASLTKSDVVSSLTELPKSKYTLIAVTDNPPQISDFVRNKGYQYSLGVAYYQLSKREEIQVQKKICIVDKKTKKVYTGQQARDLLGLPDTTTKVSPQYNPNYDVFVQSTSINRKLVPGTKLLVMK